MRDAQRAAVVGSGPNGLAAAVTLARAGVPVTVFEAAETIGGGTRTYDVVREGVLHDMCSAVHPMALATDFFRQFELTRRVEFVVPDASYAHPVENGANARAAIAYRDLRRTAEELGRDGSAYERLMAPIVSRIEGAIGFALGGSMLRFPQDPLAALALGLRTLEQGSPLWNARFAEAAAPAMLAGVAAHSIGRMPNLATSAVGMVLGALGHTTGWPVPIGGSRTITDALATDLLAHGGKIETGHPISHLGELSAFDVKLFDTSARGLASIAGAALPARYRRALERFRYGDAATKVDFVLDGPIPWADPRIAAAPTVHVGGTREEIAAAEREVAAGRHPERPYALVAQTAGVDPHRSSPAARQAGLIPIWCYTHVPAGSDVDVSAQVIRQIERFAPGFRDRIVDLRVTTAKALSGYNRNYHGGDFSAGAVNIRQLLARPVLSRDPWRTPAEGVYLCSSSASPGPGVHGLGGWYAACSALRHEFGLPAPALGVDTRG